MVEIRIFYFNIYCDIFRTVFSALMWFFTCSFGCIVLNSFLEVFYSITYLIFVPSYLLVLFSGAIRIKCFRTDFSICLVFRLTRYTCNSCRFTFYVAGGNDKTVRPHDGEFLSSQYRHYRRQYIQLPLSQVNLSGRFILSHHQNNFISLVIMQSLTRIDLCLYF